MSSFNNSNYFFQSNQDIQSYSQIDNQLNIQINPKLFYGSETSIAQISDDLNTGLTSFCAQKNINQLQENLSSPESGSQLRSSFASNQSHYSSDSSREVEMAQFGFTKINQMEIESECLTVSDETKVNYSSPSFQIASQAHLIPGDYLIEFNQLESLLQINAGNQVDFNNSQINTWKKCIQIEKDQSENGCFYVSLGQKEDSYPTQIYEAAQIIQSLKEKKLLISNQMREEESQKFENRIQMIENILESVSKKSNEAQQLQNQINQQAFYENYQLSLKKAKNIMREIVNANGSTKSFVFAQIKAFNPKSLSKEITQMIYSPKLVKILYNESAADNLFYNQILRKGIIEMFDSQGHLLLNSLEIEKSSEVDLQSSQSLKNQKISLTLYTSDNFQVPITVTLKKYNLSQGDQIQCSAVDHELLVFDIKIKIKYQKQLKTMRNNAQELLIKKKICKKNSPTVGKKMLKKKANGNHKSKSQSDCQCSSCQTNQTENQQEYFGYYLETLGFLNKFYPEKLQSDSDKFDLIQLSK
ncbi:hypothetical protein TTHERM_01196970 (macronuclear) [Tetrahymena thermophila SB210]|uniref:Uncharacterized protein n=1 Tax=Tetrahymena thermophila (strain SB210) TaxID=312017 RepID=Q23U31_TETTS|nr:hypothetical protein TTHERM_01196970 [Tetrahymena thermophila SB210]EAS00019.1 hypothetical protein TTHERM_01196970 [Tetrahymena thermophila SB210]|eukprot:XP_001020264.1 hypothetical protein TTHERM_01196970 [Tetrahymena thermophila SB210]